MGFFSSIKRLWSSNKTAETPETPQVPAEEALAAQPAETEDGASHEESSVSDAPQSPVEVLEKLPETAAAEQQQVDLEMDQLAAGQSLEPDGQAPAPAAAAQPAPQPDAPKEPSGWRDTLLLTLREAEPRLSVWLSIALEDLGPDARTGDELWEACPLPFDRPWSPGERSRCLRRRLRRMGRAHGIRRSGGLPFGTAVPPRPCSRS